MTEAASPSTGFGPVASAVKETVSVLASVAEALKARTVT
jgi:hypothetical protein